MRYGNYGNREDLVKKEFTVKVAYSKHLKDEITEMSIYNGITGVTNYIECEVEEVKNV